MNFPTTDVQFIAQMLIRTRAGDQITAEESRRLDSIAQQGYSSPADAPTAGDAVLDPDSVAAAQAAGATRVQR